MPPPCEHQWGQWGVPKPNDEGEILAFRRCQACDFMESRPGYFTVNFDSAIRLSLPPRFTPRVRVIGA
jgi:hypothetical protein